MSRQKDAEKEEITVVNETIASLLTKSERIDSVCSGTNLYSVETCLKANPQQWYYRSLVRYRGKEVVSDGKLEKVKRWRKRSTQFDKTKILWEKFVEDAALLHLERVRELKRREKKEAIKVKSSRKVFLPVLTGVVVIGLSVTVQYQLDPKLKFVLPDKEKAHTLSSQRSGLSVVAVSEDEKSPFNPDLPAVTKKGETAKPSAFTQDVNHSQENPTPHVETKTISLQNKPHPEPVEVELVETPHPLNTIRKVEKRDVLSSDNDKKESKEVGHSETQAVPAEIHQSKIEEDASIPESSVEEATQRNENLDLQEPHQSVQKNPGQNRGQGSVSQQFSLPEIEPKNEESKTVAEKRRQAAELSGEGEKTEKLSQEEIRKKIKAILGNSNN